jgi:hypothetical protein
MAPAISNPAKIQRVNPSILPYSMGSGAYEFVKDDSLGTPDHPHSVFLLIPRIPRGIPLFPDGQSAILSLKPEKPDWRDEANELEFRALLNPPLGILLPTASEFRTCGP